MERNRVRRLNGGVWPPQSPDLNPVEHIWPQVNRSLYDRVYNSKDDLWSALEAGFAAVPKEYVVGLYASMQRRLTAVLVAKGAHTKY